MTRISLEQDLPDRDFLEKNVVDEKVVSSPPSEVEQGIINDWDGEEAAVRRKYV